MRCRPTSDAGASGLIAVIGPRSEETRRLDDLVDRVVPHFIRYPLLSGKRFDFERFAFVCWQMKAGAHRRVDGLVQIVKVASEMNPSGKRRYDASAILVKLLQGEGIVCASGNRG
jgi:hypothetical protein